MQASIISHRCHRARTNSVCSKSKHYSPFRGVERERPRCWTSARGALTARCRLPSACFGRLHRVWPSLFLFLLWLPWLVLFCTVLLSCVCKLLPSAIIVHPPLLPARWKRFLMRVIMPCRTGVGSTVCNGVVLSAFRVNIENGSKRALQLRLLLWVLRGRAFSGGIALEFYGGFRGGHLVLLEVRRN